MPTLTPEGRTRVDEIARRNGFAPEVAERLTEALVRGGGTQAQFADPNLGGLGQWSRGGMIMIGDMFNNALKARVDALCNELAALIGAPGLFAADPATGDWPAALGRASSTGAQNDMRYAVFPDTRRLAVSRGGTVTIYDTGAHHIGGASQAQSGDQTLSFSSQLGTVRLTDLPVVPAEGAAKAPAEPAKPTAPAPAPEPQAAAPATPAPNPSPAATNTATDPLALLERLAELKARGVITQDEFDQKKAELLSRI